MQWEDRNDTTLPLLCFLKKDYDSCEAFLVVGLCDTGLWDNGLWVEKKVGKHYSGSLL